MNKPREYLVKNLPNKLISEGVKFKSFSLTSKGTFLGKDVDWNFKDILHPKLVHKLLDQTHIYTSDFTTTQIFFQNFIFFKIPFQVIQYDTGPNSLSYCFTLFGFVIYIETKYETKKKITTITTTYNIGSINKLFLNLSYPILRFILTKNYKKLMSEDMPLRLRKGELRNWGMTFKTDKLEKISYHDCKNISNQNVIFSNKFNSSISKKILITKRHNGDVVSFLTGRSDNFGLKGEVIDGIIYFYPRVCSHEGACLDNGKFDKNFNSNFIKCPWHEKKIKPVYKHKLNKNDLFKFNYSNRIYKFKIVGIKSLKNLDLNIS